MHNNYYFLRQLTQQLSIPLKDAVVSECFSQSREELVIRFETYADPFFIKAALRSDFSCITCPPVFHRARKNSIDLFPLLIGQRVQSIRQFENERSFSLEFTNDHVLLFKMHGNRSNVILFENQSVADYFKKSLKGDVSIQLSTLDKKIDWSYEAFEKHASNPEVLYYTFGKPVWQYLRARGYESLSVKEKWQSLQETRRKLENPLFVLARIDQKPALMLLPVEDAVRGFSSPIEAVNEFYHFFTNTFALEKEKQLLIGKINSQLASAHNYIAKNRAKMTELESGNNYKFIGDLIMANMHLIDDGATSATVANFYDEGRPIEIKLKPTLSPQKNAEAFYRKAKNQQIEISHLRDAVTLKEKQIHDLLLLRSRTESTVDLKSLRALNKSIPESQSAESLPYHEFTFGGFRIMVGKNAEANDELTRLAYKEDLWLHAKDVSGSHVIVKYQSGKNFPRNVIERAAELAAYNSKRKNDSLCPVVYTPRKYVRKRKGDPPGLVVVEREQVLLVEPKL